MLLHQSSRLFIHFCHTLHHILLRNTEGDSLLWGWGLPIFCYDTTILHSHKDMASQINLINMELLEVSNWFKANKLSVNASKTNYMTLGTPQMTSNCFTDVDTNDESDMLNTSNVILDGTKLFRVKKKNKVSWSYNR